MVEAGKESLILNTFNTGPQKQFTGVLFGLTQCWVKIIEEGGADTLGFNDCLLSSTLYNVSCSKFLLNL